LAKHIVVCFALNQNKSIKYTYPSAFTFNLTKRKVEMGYLADDWLTFAILKLSL